jgi:hypothetical protein
MFRLRELTINPHGSQRGPCGGGAARLRFFAIVINGLPSVNLSARRFFLRSWLKKSGAQTPSKKPIRG